jgi:RimJ/RimL family protein N-acetyltransferase
MLRGEKVILRAIEREDVKRLHELESNVDLTILAHGAWNPYSLAAAEKEWEKALTDEDMSRFVIVADDTVIGGCGLHSKSRRDGTAAVGISIFDPPYLSKGYGRDALRVLVDWGFRVQNYRRIWLDTLATNERAIRSYLACGFVQEGVLRQHYYANGEYHDAVVMGILRTEWEQSAERKA